MYFIRFLWPELIGAVSAWNTHSHHVLDSGRWWYGHNHSIWAICIRFAKPTFHFSLSFTNLVIICGAFEFNAGASVLFVIICYNDVRLSFHISSQAAQTHVAMEGCNVIYITYVTRAGVALQATVENIRDFVWEICHWDLRTPNNAKPYFSLNEMNKKVLPAIYSAAVWCLFVVLLFFGFIA